MKRDCYVLAHAYHSINYSRVSHETSRSDIHELYHNAILFGRVMQIVIVSIAFEEVTSLRQLLSLLLL